MEAPECVPRHCTVSGGEPEIRKAAPVPVEICPPIIAPKPSIVSPFSSPLSHELMHVLTNVGCRLSSVAAAPPPSSQHHPQVDACFGGREDAQQEAQRPRSHSLQPQEPPRCSITQSASGLLSSVLAYSSLATSTANNQPVPPHGVKAVCGKRAKMEDTFSVQTNFMDVQMSQSEWTEFQNKLPARIASQVGEELDQQISLPLSPNSTCVTSLCSSTDTEASVGGSSISSDAALSTASCDTLHFFAVYDGHGGVEAAQHCANRLHHHLSSALAMVLSGSNTAMHTDTALCVANTDGDSSCVQCEAEWKLCTKAPRTSSSRNQQEAESPPPVHTGNQWCPAASGGGAAVGDDTSRSPQQQRSPSPEQQEAHDTHVAGSAESPVRDCDANSTGSDITRSENSCLSALEEALRNAFLRTDEEFAEDGSSAMVGSTAVVALVGSKKMWIANCGDSRAVLCRGGKAFQVTDDHKPEREDEAERVEKAGGQVLYWNGHRVMGVLAMSRAIGDHGLRPYVIPEPEITVLARVNEDDFLLLASDGLWDVMTNQEAITLAMRCLQRSWEKGTSRKAAVRVAATVLTRAAVDRGSKDNVTVVIIDLKAPQDGGAAACDKQEGTSPCSPCSCTPSPVTGCSSTSAGGGEVLVSQDTLEPSCQRLSRTISLVRGRPGESQGLESQDTLATPPCCSEMAVPALSS